MLEETAKVKEDLAGIGFEKSEISVRANKRKSRAGNTMLEFDIQFKVEEILNRISDEDIKYPSFEATEILADYFRERAEDFVRLGFSVTELNGKWFNIEVRGATEKDKPSYTVLEGVKGIRYKDARLLVSHHDVDVEFMYRSEVSIY